MYPDCPHVEVPSLHSNPIAVLSSHRPDIKTSSFTLTGRQATKDARDLSSEDEALTRPLESCHGSSKTASPWTAALGIWIDRQDVCKNTVIQAWAKCEDPKSDRWFPYVSTPSRPLQLSLFESSYPHSPVGSREGLGVNVHPVLSIPITAIVQHQPKYQRSHAQVFEAWGFSSVRLWVDKTWGGLCCHSLWLCR